MIAHRWMKWLCALVLVYIFFNSFEKRDRIEESTVTAVKHAVDISKDVAKATVKGFSEENVQNHPDNAILSEPSINVEGGVQLTPKQTPDQTDIVVLGNEEDNPVPFQRALTYDDFKDGKAPIITPLPENSKQATKFEKKVARIMSAFFETSTGRQIVDEIIAPAYDREHAKKQLGRNEPKVVIFDTVLGNQGAPAVCGQTASFYYHLYHQDTELASQALPHKPMALRLGSKEMMQSLSSAIIGMQPGGARQFRIPHELIFDMPDTLRQKVLKSYEDEQHKSLYHINLTGDITLLTLQPALPTTRGKVTILSEVAGKGQRVHCGDKVGINYRLSSVEGQPIAWYDNGSEPLIFLLGGDETPIIVSQLLTGDQSGSIYKLLVPASWLRSLSGKLSSQLQQDHATIPNQGMLLLELHNLGPQERKVPAVEPDVSATVDELAS